MTTSLSLMEVYYVLLRDGTGVSEAQRVVSSFEPYLVDFSFEDVRRAMELRLSWQRKGKKVSYVDAISYHIARDRRMTFLTGDPAFKGVAGVTFLRMPRP